MQDIHVDKRLLAVSKLPLMCQPLFSDGSHLTSLRFRLPKCRTLNSATRSTHQRLRFPIHDARYAPTIIRTSMPLRTSNQARVRLSTSVERSRLKCPPPDTRQLISERRDKICIALTPAPSIAARNEKLAEYLLAIDGEGNT